MSYNESSYEQTRIIRDAVEMAVRLTPGGDGRRDEVVRVILKIANQDNYDASALASLAITAMTEVSRKTA
jgi:hypothetical protein